MNESASASPASPETFSPSSLSQSSKGSLGSTVLNNTGYPNSNNSLKEVVGKLIIVPPQVAYLIQTYQHNPAYIRSCIGDDYWNLLCEPYTDTSSTGGYPFGLYRQWSLFFPSGSSSFFLVLWILFTVYFFDWLLLFVWFILSVFVAMCSSLDYLYRAVITMSFLSFFFIHGRTWLSILHIPLDG